MSINLNTIIMETNMTSKAYFDKESNAAIGEFVGFLKPDEFKSIANKLIQMLEEKDLKRQINDVKLMKVLSQDTQNWLNTDWFPRAKEAGLKFFAFVVPEDIFGKMSMKGANRKAENMLGIEIQYFSDMELAKDWVKSKV